MRKLTIALVLFAAACGGSKKDTAPTTTAPVAVTAEAGTKLELAEMKLVDVNKNEALMIHADGSIEVEGKTPAKVQADGKIVTTDNGTVVAQLEPDGSVTAQGKPVGVTIAADGSFTIDGKTVSLDDGGMLVGGNPDAPKLRVEGATNPGLKRTAMFVLIALTMSAGGPPPPAPTSGGSGPAGAN
ncbi:MAG: hypothetical protein JWP01_2888 [Myxococcales bacterium]|nr:hypothetical protein [Myxococcales bacterium]